VRLWCQRSIRLILSRVFQEGAQITDRLPLSAIPLACMLGGEDRRTLFIATTESQDPTDRQARGRIETIQVEVAGTGLP